MQKLDPVAQGQKLLVEVLVHRRLQQVPRIGWRERGALHLDGLWRQGQKDCLQMGCQLIPKFLGIDVLLFITVGKTGGVSRVWIR